MRIRGAVLEEIGRARPYANTKPLTISELELDAPGPGEVLVRIEAAGICHSDLSVVDGADHGRCPCCSGTRRAAASKWRETAFI